MRIVLGVMLLLANVPVPAGVSVPGRVPVAARGTVPADTAPSVCLSDEVLVDRVQAVWLAQIIAVTMGWPFEHKPAAVAWVDQLPRDYDAAPVDDDWYYEIALLRALERHGPALSVEALGQQWLENNVGTWGSSEQARLNLQRGVKAPDSGHPRYNRLWFTMGNQCRGDLFGLLLPGRPTEAARLARRLGHINSYAEGTDGGVLVATMISLAFVERDPQAIVRKAATVLHPESPHRRMLDEVIALADAGRSAREIADVVEDRWHIEYPATNNSVANAGLAALGVWFGKGDFLTSVNIVYAAADYTDADCNAAVAAAVVAAMHGMRALPPHLVAPFRNRIVGATLGPVPLTPPVDERISDLATRTVKMARRFADAPTGDLCLTPRAPEPLPLERFRLADFTQYWNPAWTLERAGFGAPGGGVRDLRGGTYLDGDVLATYPRDEVRGVVLRRRVRLGPMPVLTFETAADPGRAWRLSVFADNTRLRHDVVDGGPALAWEEAPPLSYPESEFVAFRRARRWQRITVDLAAFAGREVELRLYQTILVRDRVPGNAYWRDVRVE
jgi:hypothetical protein